MKLFSYLFESRWRAKGQQRESDRLWKHAKFIRIDEQTCRGLFGHRIVLGREARQLRMRVHKAKSVVLSNCELHSGSREASLPIFAECRVLFLERNNPEFNAHYITPEVFPKLRQVYVHGSLGSSSVIGLFSDVVVEWFLTRNSPIIPDACNRIVYSEFISCMKDASCPRRKTRSRKSTIGSSMSSNSSTDSSKEQSPWKRWGMRGTTSTPATHSTSAVVAVAESRKSTHVTARQWNVESYVGEYDK